MIPMLFFMYQFYFPTRKVSTVLRNVHCFIHFLFFLPCTLPKKQQEELCTSPASVPLKKHIIV